MTIILMIDYFEIHDINYSKTQLSIQNAYALIIHKIQTLIFNNVIINLNFSMFVRKHVYTTLSKVQKFNQIEIITLNKKTFKINKKILKKYERLQKKYNIIVRKQMKTLTII